MTGSQLTLIVSSSALLVASGIVGVRLLVMSRKTRQLPEFFLGAGSVSVLLIYLPLMALTGLGRAPVGEVKLGLLAVASVFMWFGMSALFCFTWKAFRPDRDWAMWLCFVNSGLCALACGGMIASVMSSPADMPSFKAAQIWTGLMRVPMVINFLWTGYEGAANYIMCRRRQTLGLSDPVVANRFLLWAIVGFSEGAINLMSLALHVQGQGIMASPLALFLISVGGFTSAVLMILTFLPPAAYVKFLKNRARGQEI